MSKQVEIHRHYGFIHAANNGQDAKDYFDMAYKAVGSYFKELGRSYASGLTREEENILMPEIVDFYPEDRKEFRKAVNDYFKNINTKIPAEGLKLNIELENPKKPLSLENLPKNPSHYIAYKHAIGHPQVAATKEEAERMGHLASFYILDQAKETAIKSSLNRLEDDASRFYFEARDDQFRVTQLLTLLGVNPKTLSVEDREMKLKSLATIDEAQTEKVNRERLSKFIDTAKDKEIAIKYDILQLISNNILERVGFKILDKDSGEIIGNNLKEAVLWFKDKGNSKDVNVYYAKLKEFGGTAKEYAEELAANPPAEEPVDKGEKVEISDSAMSDFNADDAKKGGKS